VSGGFKATRLVLIELIPRHFNHAQFVIKTPNETNAANLKRTKRQKPMNSRDPQSEFRGQAFHVVILIVCMGLLSLRSPVAVAQEAPPAQSQETTATEEAPTLPPDQLDSLVAPIALYSDSLLAQTLAASTYPLEVIQLQQWIEKNKNLQGQALADAVSKQPWDPSVQGLVAFPDVVTRMAENVQWTTDLGNAFLAQQSDVMDSVQRMRGKAQGTGNLKTSSQQKVESKTVEGGKQVIEIQQASPDTAYVPSYDPSVVYGAASNEYPYPNYTYPGYVPGSALAWGAGVAVGAAAWGAWGGNWGNWGNCDWNHGDVNVNNNNNFNKNYNKNVNRGAAGQGNQWQHNPQHRGGTPYSNKATANKYGGKTSRAGASGAGKRGGPGGVGGVGGAGKRGGPGGVGGVGSAGKPGGPGGAGAGAKAGGGAAGARAGGGGAGAKTGGNKVGNHTASSPSKGGSAFGGGSSGGAARASSSRGASSMGGPKGGGGGARGGGGRGGGGRGGGGGRRR
jgi:hypothetical protein